MREPSDFNVGRKKEDNYLHIVPNNGDNRYSNFQLNRIAQADFEHSNPIDIEEKSAHSYKVSFDTLERKLISFYSTLLRLLLSFLCLD